MRSFIIAGIGEILWDVLYDSEELGGAPINFAYHAGALGATSYPVSTIGDDHRGNKAMQELQRRGVNCDHITVLPTGITGFVQATVDDKGVASYEFPDNVAWDSIMLAEHTLSLAPTLDAVCFGSLAQRSAVSRDAIYGFLARTGPQTLKVFDLNLRQHFYTPEIIRSSLAYADVLKLNDDELQIMKEIEQLPDDDLAAIQMLIARHNLQLGVLTRGSSGSLLVSPSTLSNHRGHPSTIVDTIGAGDSFTAATVIGLLRGLPLDDINERANAVAAHVCSQKGAMPPLPERFRMG